MGEAHEVVRRGFYLFSVRYEGWVDFFYGDIDGNVTIGIGNLVDPFHLAENLPMVNMSDGQPATKEAIRASWEAVKARPELGKVGAAAYKKFNTVKLLQADIEKLVWSRFDANTRALVSDFPGFPSWPADAQLALESMAWALGTKRLVEKFPKFRAHMLRGDFEAASTEATIRTEGNPGVAPRNKKNIALLRTAAIVQARKLDFLQIWEGRIALDAPAEPPPPDAGPGAEPPTEEVPATPRVGELPPLVWATGNQSVNDLIRASYKGGDEEDGGGQA